MQLRVFLCHSSSDKPKVRELHTRLSRDGFRPWLDEIDLIAGQDWKTEIRKEVYRTDAVLVCLSRSSISKDGFVQKEIKIALDVADEKVDGTIFIIPVRLEECRVPDRLGEKQWVNLFERHGYDDLIRALSIRAAERRTSDSDRSVPINVGRMVKGGYREESDNTYRDRHVGLDRETVSKIPAGWRSVLFAFSALLFVALAILFIVAKLNAPSTPASTVSPNGILNTPPSTAVRKEERTSTNARTPTDESGIAAQRPASISIPGKQPWTDTGVDLKAGEAISINASGRIRFSAEIPSVGPDGDQTSCALNKNPRVPYVALTLRCHSLIGKVGAEGMMFQVGSSSSFHATETGRLYLGVNDNFFGDNRGTWTVQISANTKPSEVPSQLTSTQPRIAKAVTQAGTKIQLPSVDINHYGMVNNLYGMVTGGGASSSEFERGQYARVLNAAGYTSAALAYGTMTDNNYTTQTNYHVVGGVSIAGAWRSFEAFQGSNSQPGAAEASVQFVVRAKSLVVVIGLASSQQEISLSGIDLETDALNSGTGMVIAHAYLEPGTYVIVEHSMATAAGQDPQHMADLIGVFVFGL
jgi:hypothetical protein